MTMRDVADGLPSREDILRAIGLGTTHARSVSPQVSNAVGIFAAGILIGAGLALLLAPKAGIDLRRDIEEGFSALRSRILPPGSGPVPAREAHGEPWSRSLHGNGD